MNEYRYNQSELDQLHDTMRATLAHLPDQKRLQEELQIEHDAIMDRMRTAQERKRLSHEELRPYLACFSDMYGPAITDMVIFESVRTATRTAVGLTLTTLESVFFRRPLLPQFQMAPWAIDVMPILERFLRCEIELKFLEKECDIVTHALRRATKKVAMVEVVLIPQTKASIAELEQAAAYESVLNKRRVSSARFPRNRVGEMYETLQEHPPLREQRFAR